MARKKDPDERDGEVYDHLHRLFGIGEWDWATGEPYHRYRALQVHQLKGMRKKRRATCQELIDAADYCKAHRLDIRHASWLFRHIPAAKRWAAERQRALEAADLDERVAEAIAIEVRDGDPEDWVGRLVRAAGDQREEVYSQWKAARAHV